ncbi:hypothetical protein [Actinomadura sp. DC4]|uniref:hypothetical protein n=1 Tax=Actinomadura sp. DC4 TaxID=3055069 RepID=UPI0025B059F9|nr:hypothetical protein [Actinomadura sp. DC4]MDN3356728.1 hypothetical protein [Actinomadura sp. DC4]
MRKSITGLTAAAAVTALLAAVSHADAAGLPAAAAAGDWSVAQTNTLAGEDGIKQITVAPTGSTWAAGYQASGGKSVPLVQHLLSGKWTTVKSPSSTLGEVSALSASSSKSVWAFGTTDPGTFAARWNGTAWTRSTMSTGHYFIQDASALSASNVWAVGGDQTKNSFHWTGKAWKKVALPAPARAIAGVSTNHVYAAGTYKSQPAVMHWTGTAWKLAATPKLKLPNADAVGVLNDIYAPSLGDVWAAGGWDWSCGEDGDDVCNQPFLLHWNGKAWSSTTFDQGYGAFSKVTGDGSGGLWLLRGGWNPQLVHISGESVTSVAAPRPSGHDISITALALQASTVWAGGVAFPEGDPDDPTGNGLYLRTG